MKRVIVFCAMFALSNANAENYQARKDASSKSKVTIINVSGEINVTGWSRNEVEVDAELGSAVKKLVFEVDGDSVLIEVKVPRSGRGNKTADLDIKIPQGSSLDVTSVSSDITVQNVEGRQRLETVSGDVDSQTFASNVKINAVSGDLELGGNGAEIEVRAETVSGDIDMQGVSGDLRAETVSGDIAVLEGVFEEADMQTVNGDVTFNAGIHGGARVDVETVNGRVNLDLDGDVNARIDIETFNGRIRNCFGPESRRTNEYGPGRELKFTQGGGEGKIVIRTLNGSVDICNN